MTTLLTLEQIQTLAKQDMQAVDAEILAQLNSEV
ncbi:octaprenyl diphosphate synthase, partial [Xanthomonas citri pv. citri]|nr:octaprenyl diphosphate synthase [Xanthomonas citri pv. citri]